MNFEQYLIKEGVLKLERDTLIEFLVNEGVDIESLDEGFMDKLRSIKKGAMGALLALMIAKGAVAGQLDQKGINDYSNIIIKLAMESERTADRDFPVEVSVKATMSGIDDGLNKYIKQGRIDAEDKSDIIDNVLKKNQSVGEIMQSFNNDEPNRIETNPFNHLNKVTPEEWAKNTIEVMDQSKGSEQHQKDLESMIAFKSNMQKASSSEAIEFYNSAIKILEKAGIKFNW